MKELRWQVLFGCALIFLSASFYFVHYKLFNDAHHIFIYLLGDIAFVPVEVLLVTLIIHRLLERKEKHSRLEKLNMVIEGFFSEAGSALLSIFSDHDPGAGSLSKELATDMDWTDKDFKSKERKMLAHKYYVDIGEIDLERLHSLLSSKRVSLMRLWENPNLFEHESFTEVLRAVMHLAEELSSRKAMGNLTGLPPSDYQHLLGDIVRAYSLLATQWLYYIKHLKDSYPYLFSLAIRTNPFNKSSTPVVS